MNDLGLQPALQEVLNLETKNVIQLHPIIRQNTGPEVACFAYFASNFETHLTSLLRRALPSKSLLGFFSSRVSSSRAADLIRARLYFTRQT